MEGTISFSPSPDAPPSDRIGLIQAARVLDIEGFTTERGRPMDPSHPRIPSQSRWPAEALAIETAACGAVPAGWSIDVPPSRMTPSSFQTPEYGGGLYGESRQIYSYGWLERSGSSGAAWLYDYPTSMSDAGFSFELVARGMDNGIDYGALQWGFTLRERPEFQDELTRWYRERIPGRIPSRWQVADQRAHPTEGGLPSPAFEAALELHRAYFGPPCVWLRCHPGEDRLDEGEESRLVPVRERLASDPHLRAIILGLPDPSPDRSDTSLAWSRALAVYSRLLDLGVAESALDMDVDTGGLPLEVGSAAPAPGAVIRFLR